MYNVTHMSISCIPIMKYVITLKLITGRILLAIKSTNICEKKNTDTRYEPPAFSWLHQRHWYRLCLHITAKYPYIKRAFLRIKRSTADMLVKTWFIIMKMKAPDLHEMVSEKLEESGWHTNLSEMRFWRWFSFTSLRPRSKYTVPTISANITKIIT